MSAVRHDVTLLSDQDRYLFNEGTHGRLYERLGAHPLEVDGEPGTVFGVWAPNAEEVSVIGDFNGWTRGADPLRPRAGSGIWEGFVPGVGPGALHKLHIASRVGGYRVDKADPFAAYAEVAPKTGSVVWVLTYDWGDAEWIRTRGRANALDAPMSIYEVHLGSWMREDGGIPAYRRLAPRLAEHVRDLNFTHV